MTACSVSQVMVLEDSCLAQFHRPHPLVIYTHSSLLYFLSECFRPSPSTLTHTTHTLPPSSLPHSLTHSLTHHGRWQWSDWHNQKWLAPPGQPLTAQSHHPSSVEQRSPRVQNSKNEKLIDNNSEAKRAASLSPNTCHDTPYLGYIPGSYDNCSHKHSYIYIIIIHVHIAYIANTCIQC